MECGQNGEDGVSWWSPRPPTGRNCKGQSRVLLKEATGAWLWGEHNYHRDSAGLWGEHAYHRDSAGLWGEHAYHTGTPQGCGEINNQVTQSWTTSRSDGQNLVFQSSSVLVRCYLIPALRSLKIEVGEMLSVYMSFYRGFDSQHPHSGSQSSVTSSRDPVPNAIS